MTFAMTSPQRVDDRRTARRSAWPALGIAASALVFLACGSTDPAPDDPAQSGIGDVVARPGSAPAPWTREFRDEAVLIANKITIEGPADLLDHMVVRQEPGVIEMDQETVTEGLLQRVRRLPQAGAGEIRAWLDQWSLVALHELVILQRPGEVPVRVIAEGKAAWLPVQEAEGVSKLAERRSERLVFTGERGR